LTAIGSEAQAGTPTATRDPAPRARPRLSTTERNLAAGAVLAIALATAAWAARTAEGWDAPVRVVHRASETSTRFLAIAHTVVATAFLLTSRRMRAPAGWAWFAALTALGVALCFGFRALGGMEALVPAVLFYAYFLAHELRDELFFARANGDLPPGDEDASRMLWTLPLVAAAPALAGLLAVSAWTTHGWMKLHRTVNAIPAFARDALVVGAILAAALAVVLTWRRLRRLDPGGVAGFLRARRPLMVVFVGLYAILVTGILWTGRVYAVVAIHVCVWYVFTLRRLRERPPSPRPPPFSWSWVRSTAAGFNAFHLGVFALVVGLAIWRAVAFDNAPSPGALSVLTSKEAFPYWTLLHVTWSWVPRG
jgi:hypothetical protein